MTWKVGPGKNGTYTVYDDEGWYLMSCQDERRAQLIATAPQMLEALEAIRETAQRILADADTPTRTRSDWRTVEGFASAAIATVKGESGED